MCLAKDATNDQRNTSSVVSGTQSTANITSFSSIHVLNIFDRKRLKQFSDEIFGNGIHFSHFDFNYS